MNHHVIVVSVDALVYEDLDYASTLPHFGKLLANGARINKVHSIYPTLTHPIHVSMMTGAPAGKTGIIANEYFQPGTLERTWFNDIHEVKTETIFHAAHRAGLTTCACRWPVTAGATDVIDYLVPEVMGLDMRGNEDHPCDVYRALGTSECVMDIVQDALSVYGTTNAHPAYDEFEIYCAAQIIRRYRPNLLMTHPGYVDGERHRTGLFTDAVKESIAVTDRWLGMLMDAVRDAGIEENTDFIVLSDHGHLNILRTVCPNVFLADAGLIRTDKDGALLEWDAYCSSCALSSQVYLKDPGDGDLYDRVYTLLSHLAEEKIYGFERVFTKEEVKDRYGLDGAFSFVLETDGFTTFSDSWVRPVVRDFDLTDYRFGQSTHGHMPEKGPQPPFIGAGPSFAPGVVLETGDILNHAPTIAALLGLQLSDAEGHAETALFRAV